MPYERGPEKFGPLFLSIIMSDIATGLATGCELQQVHHRQGLWLLTRQSNAPQFTRSLSIALLSVIWDEWSAPI